MNIVSLFSGAGGLDLGFKRAGFNIVWANEFDKSIWETYKRNHPETILNTNSITKIEFDDIPNCDGIIGGPPCQSWSEAGSKKGIADERGKLFFSFIDVVSNKKPKFFLAENVPGILAERNKNALNDIISSMKNKDEYSVYYKALNAKNLGAAQDRKRVIFIGIRKDIVETIFKNLNEDEIIKLIYPEENLKNVLIKDVIFNLRNTASKFNKNEIKKDNHEYLEMDFSPMFMSRNRIRRWDQKSFTIQASGRHSPLHPDSGIMKKIAQDQFIFLNKEQVRRLTVRESARLQGFPDEFNFYYSDILNGYKMVGNAVNVDMAEQIAKKLFKLFN